METKYAPLGSVSSGTMRPEDLIPAFLDVLAALDKPAADAIAREYEGVVGCLGDESNTNPESEDWFLEALFDELNEQAPPYARFGAHEGDGADYGFWIDWQLIEDDAYDGILLKVRAGDPWPDPLPEEAQYVVEVNDHGNASLFTADHVEVWAVV